MRLFFPASLTRQNLLPPLQPDFSGQWFTHGVTHASDLGIEGVQSIKRISIRLRRKQRSEKSIVIGFADQRGAMFKIAVHR